jgi:thiamine pyrophosphate-dependent acetolactate synthase large subunit-like protein
MKCYELLADAVAGQGIDTVFGLIGDANLFWVDHYVRHSGGRYVAAANEGGAVSMANGYACTSGRVGVATVTHGPGLTNTATALVEAARNHTPLVLIAGDTSVTDREHLQDIDQRSFVAATGGLFERVRAPDTLVADLTTAVRLALVEQRPVVLDVPVDFQWRDVEGVVHRRTAVADQAVRPDPDRLDEAVGIIASARRPVVLAGRGAAAAGEAMLALAQRIGAPVATTLKARDLFRGDPCDLGIFGTLSEDVSTDVILESDCVVAFGAGLWRRTTVDGSLLRGKRLVQCDIDPAALGRQTSVDCGIVGDAAAVADAIVGLLDDASVEASTFRSPGLARRLADGRAAAAEKETAAAALAPSGAVSIAALAHHVESVLPSDRTLVFDAGRFCYDPLRIMHVPDPRALVLTFNFGSIGLGVPNAIGAAIGAPDRTCVVVCGDGGFMLGGLTEFNTAVREGLDLVVVVCNDGSYGAEHIQFTDRGMDPSLTVIDWPDLASVAAALGGAGVTVRTNADLARIEPALGARDRPLLINVMLDPAAMPNRR